VRPAPCGEEEGNYLCSRRFQILLDLGNARHCCIGYGVSRVNLPRHGKLFSKKASAVE
jgi:hypothetical protein